MTAVMQIRSVLAFAIRYFDPRWLPVGQITSDFEKPVQSLREKYFASVFQKYVVCSRHPALPRGAYRDRHERWVGCGGREQRD